MKKSKKIISILSVLTIVISIAYCSVISSFALSNKEIIFNYLVEEIGYNKHVAYGVLGNICRESSFNQNASRKEINGDISYGICQWLGDRRYGEDGLETFCEKNELDYQTLEAQLEFLKYELTSVATYKKNVHSYLISYTDDMEGLMNAAEKFCIKFEAPANINSMVSLSQCYARDFMHIDNGTSDAPVINLTDPVRGIRHFKGSPMNIRGAVATNNGGITTVDAYLKDSSGNVVQSVTTTASLAFDIAGSSINMNLIFGILDIGDYTLEITASNSKGSATAETQFTVYDETTNPLPTIDLTSPANGTKISVGSSLGVWGMVYTSGKETTVTATVKNADGENALTPVTVVSSKDFSLDSSAINNNLTFGRLKEGIYTLEITATNELGEAIPAKSVIAVGDSAISLAINDMKLYYVDELSANYPKTAKIIPEIIGGSGDYTYTWTSSDKSVVDVDENGNAKALKVGSATITCTVKDNVTEKTVSDTCEVEVISSWWQQVISMILQVIEYLIKLIFI